MLQGVPTGVADGGDCMTGAMRVLIGVPCRDTMPTATAKSLCALPREYDIVFGMEGSLPEARNKLCELAIRGRYDALLQIDSDMAFLPQHVAELIRHASGKGYPIVSGRYIGRSRPHQFHAYNHPIGGKRTSVAGVVKRDESTVVDYTGAGFLYTSRQVLEALPQPWFDHTKDIGEDAYFCRRALKEAGLQTRLYAWVTVGHVGTILYSDPQYEAILQ